MRRILFWPYQLYAWLIFMPFVALWTLLCGWLTVLVAIIVNPRIASRWVAVPWARVTAWLTPMWVSVQGSEHANPARTYVVVSNHASQYDILAVYGWLNLDLKWVMKQELRKIPGIGIGCEKAGHIFVDRKRPEKAKQAINDALLRLGSGVGILFFPEGTRSLDGRLLPFKTGAFRTALDQELPILPVTLIGTRDILPAKTRRLFPGRARMVVHPAIETDGRDLRDLLKEARATISQALPPELRGDVREDKRESDATA